MTNLKVLLNFGDIRLKFVEWTRESYLTGRMTSCMNWFKLAAFNTETIFFLFYKTTYLNKEVNHSDPSPIFVFPGWTNQGNLTDQEGSLQLTSLY
jgi:hypothetical protein